MHRTWKRLNIEVFSVSACYSSSWSLPVVRHHHLSNGRSNVSPHVWDASELIVQWKSSSYTSAYNWWTRWSRQHLRLRWCMSEYWYKCPWRDPYQKVQQCSCNIRWPNSSIHISHRTKEVLVMLSLSSCNCSMPKTINAALLMPRTGVPESRNIMARNRANANQWCSNTFRLKSVPHKLERRGYMRWR